MTRVWFDADREHFWLVPEDAIIPAGNTPIRSLTGGKVHADVDAMDAYALEREDAIGATWQLGGPKVYTLRELVQWTADTLGLRRTLIGLPDGLSRLQASVMDFVPGKPFSTDNYKSLQVDNVTTDNALPRLGIRPASIDAVVPEYLVASSRQRRLKRARGAPQA